MTVPIKYRISSVATKPVTDSVKGVPLTSLEIDGNFRSIKDAIEDFSETGGSALVGYDGGTVQDVLDNLTGLDAAPHLAWIDPVAPAFLKTVSDMKNGDEVSLFRGIPKSEHAAIQSHTSAFDVTSIVQEFVTAGRNFYAPFGSYLMTGTVSAATLDGFSLRGDGFARRASGRTGRMTRFYTATNLPMFSFDDCTYPVFRSVMLDQVGATHTTPHINFLGCNNPNLLQVRIQGNEDQTQSGPGVLISGKRTGWTSGDAQSAQALIQGSVFSNAGVDVRQWDCKIDTSWLWANNKPWAVRADSVVAGNSIGNLTMTSVDLVPPRLTVSAREAAIHFNGQITQPKLIGCYADGNYKFNTGHFLLAEGGVLGLQVIGGHANGCSDHVIIIDGCFVPKIEGFSFFDNNRFWADKDNGAASPATITGNTAHDILIRQTGATINEKPRVQGTTHLMATTRTNMGAAIAVAAGTSRRKMLLSASIHQPGGGGGYREEEIWLEDGAFAATVEGEMVGTAGSRRTYKAEGSATLTAGDTFKTVTLNAGGAAALAYLPRADQVRVVLAGTSSNIAVGYRVQVVSTTQVLIGFNTALGGSGTVGTVHVSVEL